MRRPSGLRRGRVRPVLIVNPTPSSRRRKRNVRASSLRKSDCPNQVSSIGQCFATNQTPLRFQPICKKRENLFPSIDGRFLAVTLLVDEVLKPVPGAVVAVKLVLDAGGGERGG